MLVKEQILQNRYRIIRPLGQGGMGAVYEAIDERFGEPIALKEIIFDSTNETQKQTVIMAFEREAKSLAKVKHEAVPFVRDYFTESESQFLVMELIEGEDLDKMMEKRQSPFSLDEVLNWMEQLLDALDYLHNLTPPIIHRDIKPQNLKINSRNRLKLLDFGVARSNDKTSNTITNQTFVGATLNYSPIEQILRVIDSVFREFIILKHPERANEILSQDTDERCDIYALGGTFYHLLTNHVPVESTKRTIEIWEGEPDPLPTPAELNPSIPPLISDCLMKALETEQDKRYSSAIEMREALKYAIAESTNFVPFTISNESISGQTNVLPETIVSPDFSSKETDFSWTELTGTSYLRGLTDQEKKPEPMLPKVEVPTRPNISKKFPLWLIIPFGAICFFLISGTAGLVWFSQSATVPTPSSIAVANATITPQPQNTVPTVSTTNTPIIQSTTTPKTQPTTKLIDEDKPKSKPPIVEATPNKTPNTITKKTSPNIERRIPVRTTPPKTKQDPNCVFTNSCQ